MRIKPETILIAEDEPEWVEILKNQLTSHYPHAIISIYHWMDEVVSQTNGRFDLALCDVGLGAHINSAQLGWGIGEFSRWLLRSGTHHLVMITGGSAILRTTEKHLRQDFPTKLIGGFEKRYLPEALFR